MRFSVDDLFRAGGRWHRPLSIATLAVFLSLWHVRVTGNLSWTALAAFMLFVIVCLGCGHVFLAASERLFKSRAGLSFQFLCGFFLFNTVLFVLSLISPFGMAVNCATLALLAIGLSLLVGRRRSIIADPRDELPSALCLIVSGVAATLWCSDSQAPLMIHGQTAVFQTWQDMFIHVREISVFANAHGIGTIQDIKLAGGQAPIYHFASYVSAAAVSALTNTPAIEVYSSFQLPLGIFLTGLAAFSLVASIFGAWPALAAAIAVVLLPDAYQQGFANKYLSYNFLAQVNLGMLYGIACAALAWIFVLEGCAHRRYLAILIGYVFLVVCLFYKAHIFVANAFLLLMYPCIFFPGIRRRLRLAIGIVFIGVFVIVVSASQTIDRVPILRLDGSGIGRYVVRLLQDYDEGFLKSFFTQVFMRERHSKPVESLYVAAMLLISTFGLWIVAMLWVPVRLRARIPRRVLLIPVLIVANYLVMSIGLAPDSRGIGTADELLNRPLVWAYFGVVAWTAGGAYYSVFGDGIPSSRMARGVLVALWCSALVGPALFARDLQTFPTRGGYASYDQFNAVNLCLVRASQYIRDHSDPHDIIQDSEDDPRFVVTALAERQLFVGKTLFGGRAVDHQERLEGLKKFRDMQDANEIGAYASSKGVSWYLLHPSTPVSWPSSLLRKSVFDCGGYRVYRFAQ